MSTRAHPAVLLPFDRSGDSGAAVDRIATLLPDADVTVLTVWTPGSSGERPDPAASESTPAVSDAARRETAMTRAAVGARHASEAGLAARVRCQVALAGTAAAIVAVAEEMDADLIVMGRHGRSGIRYSELGETVRGVLEHSGRTVLVVSGRDVPHDTAARGGTPSAGHGGVHVGPWIPRTPDDQQDGSA